MSGAGYIRREVFGVFGAGALGALGLGPLVGGARAEAAPRLTVVAETGAPESRRFATALASAELLAVSPAMTELLGGIGAGADAVVGLTSDPTAMVARQLLLERRARPIFRWVHRYESGEWHHDIDAAAGPLSGSGSGWPAALAAIVGRRLGAAGSDRVSCASGPCPLARRSSGLLVSWAFETARGA